MFRGVGVNEAFFNLCLKLFVKEKLKRQMFSIRNVINSISNNIIICDIIIFAEASIKKLKFYLAGVHFVNVFLCDTSRIHCVYFISFSLFHISKAKFDVVIG